MADAGQVIWNLVLGVIGLLLAIVGALMVRTLNKIDAAMERFSLRQEDQEKRIARMEGYQKGLDDGRNGWHREMRAE